MVSSHELLEGLLHSSQVTNSLPACRMTLCSIVVQPSSTRYVRVASSQRVCACRHAMSCHYSGATLDAQARKLSQRPTILSSGLHFYAAALWTKTSIFWRAVYISWLSSRNREIQIQVQIQNICMQERYAEGTKDILRQYLDGKPIDEKYIVIVVSLFNETLLIWANSYAVMWGPRVGHPCNGTLPEHMQEPWANLHAILCSVAHVDHRVCRLQQAQLIMMLLDMLDQTVFCVFCRDQIEGWGRSCNMPNLSSKMGLHTQELC